MLAKVLQQLSFTIFRIKPTRLAVNADRPNGTNASTAACGDMLLAVATMSSAATIRDKAASSSSVAMWGVKRSGNAPSTMALAKASQSSSGPKEWGVTLLTFRITD